MNYRKHWIVLCVSIVLWHGLEGRVQRCAIVDTTAREQELYKPLTEILSTAGYSVTYLGIDALMDGTPKTLNLAGYDTIFFLLGSEFFCGLPYSHVSRKILNLLADYAKIRGKTIGLFLPSLRAGLGMNVVSCFAPAFNAMGLRTPLGALADPFFKVVNTFLALPLEMRALGYHTTLNPPRLPFDTTTAILSDYHAQKAKEDALYLPMRQDCCPEIQATLPYGVYWYNAARKNHIFVSTLTLATFSGITESFHVCPVRFDLRYQMHEMLLQTMCELREFSCGGKPQEIERPVLPTFLKKFGDPLDVVVKQGRKIAWMELDLFEDRDYTQTKLSKGAIAKDKADRQERRARFIGYVMASGVDTLWISMSPNTYYSSIARHNQQKGLAARRKEQQFLSGIKRFTSMLKNEAQKCNTAIPSIFVGFEIANNLYAPNLPQRCAVDVYGNSYPDLPAPLDRNFWHNEIKEPLLTFLEKWRWPEVGSGIPIAGVVIDLEMYCRKKTGTFLSTMGFDGYSFSRFLHTDQTLSVHDRGLYLMQHNKTRGYYSFLEQQAKELGSDLYGFFHRNIPGCRIMCYTPNILVSWFYKGFFKGLSKNNAPLDLMTFNAEFKAHRPWFTRNSINVHHDSVLLLSKIATLNDTKQVGDILKRHHGIWLNRFSRFAEPKTKAWTSVEQPALPEYQYSDLLAEFKAME